MPAKDPLERSLHAQIGGHALWAKTTDRAARTAAARAAFWQKFLDEADGDPVRAEHLRQAHYARLRAKSLQARRRAKEQAELADAADAEIEDLAGEEAGA